VTARYACAVSLFDFGTDRETVGPLLFAHRGAVSSTCVENTLPAFRNALALGADVLELDVHASRDGEVIVSHDPTGERLAGTRAAIAHTSSRELASWSLRAHEGAAPQRLTSLDELLRELPGVRLNIDVKQTEPDMCGPLLATIARHVAAPRVLVTSFSSRTLQRIERLGYAGPLGLGQLDAMRAAFLPAVVNRVMQLRQSRIQIPMMYLGLDLTRASLIRKLHAQGLFVDYWVVNDQDEIARLLDLGADGIVTDEIERAAAVFATHARTAGYRARRAAVRALR
jgi:glycerophosphoryl diester phosphodiesterase